jgi:hypothetical protein
LTLILRFLLPAAPLLLAGCTSDLSGPEALPLPPAARPSFSYTLSDYFPPSEASGGWRVGTSAAKAASLGMDWAAIAGQPCFAISDWGRILNRNFCSTS